MIIDAKKRFLENRNEKQDESRTSMGDADDNLVMFPVRQSGGHFSRVFRIAPTESTFSIFEKRVKYQDILREEFGAVILASLNITTHYLRRFFRPYWWKRSEFNVIAIKEHKSLLIALSSLIREEARPDVFATYLSELRNRYSSYAEFPEDYTEMIALLVQSMRSGMADKWTSKLDDGWSYILDPRCILESVAAMRH